MTKELFDYKKAADLIKQHPELSYFVGPKNETLIQKAEELLNCVFPESYRNFILEFGAGSFGAFEIYGLIDEDFLNSGIPDAVFSTFDERTLGLPENFIVIYNDGTGLLYCIDCSKSSCPIVNFYGGFPMDVQPLEMVFPNFGSFLLNIVQTVLSLPGQKTEPIFD